MNREGSVPGVSGRFINPEPLKDRITISPTSWITSGQSLWAVTSGLGKISRSSAGDATGSRLPGIWEESHGGKNIIAGVRLIRRAIPGRSCFVSRDLQVMEEGVFSGALSPIPSQRKIYGGADRDGRVMEGSGLITRVTAPEDSRVRECFLPYPR
jgi:hypothetical protein